MQRLIYILLLSVFVYSARSQCVGPQSYTLSPGGPYSPGQVVTVNYTLSSFTQINSNWITAFEIDLGQGWTNPIPLIDPQNNNTNDIHGEGYWTWVLQNTYASGFSVGPGWIFNNTGWSQWAWDWFQGWHQGDPAWGSSSTGPFTMSFQVTVGSSCTPQDLSINISVIDDCQVGVWSNGNCCSIVPYSVYSGTSNNSGITLSSNINDVSCYGYSDGSISLNISGGVPPYTYIWSNNSTNYSINNLSPGTYHVTVTDALNCTETINNLIVGEPSPISVSAGADQIICHGGTPNPISAISSFSGNYHWTPASSFIDPNISNPVFSSGFNTTTIFTVNLTDTNGCVASDSITVIVNPVPTVALSALPNPACVGDDVQLTATSSIPVNRYRFQYNSGSGWSNLTLPGFGFSNPVIYNNIITNTQFRVKVREENGCTNSNWSPVITVPINLVNTPLISHN